MSLSSIFVLMLSGVLPISALNFLCACLNLTSCPLFSLSNQVPTIQIWSCLHPLKPCSWGLLPFSSVNRLLLCLGHILMVCGYNISTTTKNPTQATPSLIALHTQLLTMHVERTKLSLTSANRIQVLRSCGDDHSDVCCSDTSYCSPSHNAV